MRLITYLLTMLSHQPRCAASHFVKSLHTDTQSTTVTTICFHCR